MLNETELREGLGRMIRVSAEDVPQSLVDSLIDEASLGAAFEAALDAPEVAATRTTINFFQVYLGRLPAAAGLDFWADKLNAGTPGDSTDDPLPTVISEFFVNSPEFFAQFGDVPSPESVVVDMFQNVLNRAPAFDGLTFWADATRIRIEEFEDAGLSRADAEKAAYSRLALDFVFAQETESRFAPGIDTLLIELANGNEDALDPGESLFDATGTFRAGIEQVGARQYELTLDDTGEEVAPFTLNGGEDSTDRLRLIGDKDVRIDLTDAAEQLEGIDIDGSGVIEFDEQDQAFRDAVNVGFFEIFDAHPRGDALLDPTNSTEGFTGDIFLDGTGFGGDGRATNGNIVLGGSGNDTIFTGIGNDFVSTGGGNDEVKLGRNADFLVQELSRLDDAFTGDDVELDGGSTFDNDPGQDNDWLLLEAGDDEEPVTVNLFQGNGRIATTNNNDRATITNFENLNASGNFYKFLAIKDQTDPTPNDIIGKVIGVGSTAFDNVNEFYGAISEITLPLGDETLSIGADALADANDFDTVLAAVKAAFEEQSQDDEGNPTVEVRAGTDASGPVIEIVDLTPEGRDFGDAEVEGSFEQLAGGFAFRQDDILPVGGEFEINALFDDVFFGDNRDFTETKTRVPGLSVGVTAQMIVNGDNAENTVIAGFDNDNVDGGGGNDLLFGGDLEFLLTHKNNPNLFDVANDLITVNTEGDGVADVGRDTLIGGDGEDDIVWDAAGGTFDGGRAGTAEGNPLPGADAADGFDPYFADTLWVTAFSVGRLADIGLDSTTDASLGTDDGGIGNNDGLNEFLGVDGDGVEARQDFTGLAEQPNEQDAADALTTDGVLRFDLGVGRGFDIQGEAGGTPVRGGLDGADRLGTADQTNYRDGVPFTTVTDIEHFNASGLGAIDYKAAGTNDPDLFFENQQNYRGTSLDIDIRGVDDARIDPNNDEQGEDSTPARAGDFSLDQLIADFNTGTASTTGAPIADLVYAGSGADDAAFGPGVQSPAENTLFTSRGDDVLEGRGGNDWLEGRAGDDQFVISLNDGDNQSGGDTPFGDDINVIARRQDADADGLLDVTADGRTVIGQDFRPFDTTITEVLPRVFAIDATGVFNIEGQVDDYTALQSITFVFEGNETQTVTLPAGGQIATAAQLETFLETVLPALDIGVQNVALGANNLDENGVFNDETDPGDFGDSVQISFAPGSSISNVIVQGIPPQGELNGGFAANEVPENDVLVDLVEDDEIVFRSYQNRLDDELIPDRLASLGRDALAEDLVFGIENGTTKLVEDQQYQIAIDDLKDGDTVSIRFNGETYSSTVGFSAVTGQDIAGESTQAFVARFVGEIQAEIARDPHSRDGNLALASAQLGTANSATITVSEAATANDGGEHVFIRFPQVSIDNNSGGDAPRYVVRETSDTSAVLYDYDWRDDSTVNTGLNRGVGVNEQRGDANDDRFITFEGDTGINRAILQNNVAGETLSGLDVVTFANRATTADADFTNENDLTRDVLNGVEDGYLGADNVTPAGNPSNPGNANGTIGQPSGGNANAPVFSALQGDDNLIGSDGDDTIDGRTGDDRVTATRGEDDLDGGVNIAINETTGQIAVENGELVQLRRSNQSAVLMPFVDVLLAREGGPADDQDFAEGALFDFTITGTADDYSLDGTLAVDEDADGVTDHTSAFSNFEVLRTISDTERDGLSFAIDVDGDTGGVLYDNSANAGDVRFVEVGNAGDDGVFGTADDLDVVAQVQGVENVTGTAEDDTLLGGSQNETLSGGDGDDLIAGGAGDDRVDGGAGTDTVGGGDGDDTVTGGDGDDALTGGAGDDLIEGGAGVDTLNGDAGNDTLDGGDGNDLLDGGVGADAVNGGAGDDVILNTADGDDGSLGDTLDGGSGDDAFHLNAGFDDANNNGVQDAGERTFVDNDAVIGGDGQDVLNVNGFPAAPVTVTFRANAGDSTDEDFDGAPATALTLDLLVDGVRTQVAVNGFDANDAASIGAAARAALVAAEIAATGAGAAVVLPAGVFVNDIDTGAARSPSADVTQGTGVDVQLLGEGAIDVEKINLNDGELTVSDNTIVNETSVVFGNASGLEIVAVDGAATNFLTSSNLTVASIDLAFGQTTLTGGDGDDTLTGSSDTSEDGGLDFGEVFLGGDGNDSIVGNTGDDDADGGAGDDVISGGTGFDTLLGGLGDDSLVGGDDGDLLLGDDDGVSAPEDHGNDTLEGGAGDDVLFGEGGDDLLDGGEDDDLLFGEEGDDTLNGGAGGDLLDGGDGNDALNAGDGDDDLFGGAGDDVLNGEGGDDDLFGEDGDDALNGGSGLDLLDGGAGNDTLNGGDGADTLDGGAGDDVLDGGSGDDQLFGGDGDDALSGGAGEDTLDGGAGNDTLAGGASTDLFLVDGSGTGDPTTITDFATADDSTGARIDQIEFQGLDVATGPGTFATLGGTGGLLSPGLTVILNDAGNGIGDALGLDTASVAALLADLDPNATGDQSVEFGASPALVAVSDGNQTGIFRAEDLNGDTVVDADELTEVLRLANVANTATLEDTDFLDFEAGPDTIAPVVPAGQSFSLTENVLGAGGVVGTVDASDNSGSVNLSITAGDPGGFFALASNGTLSLTPAGAAGAANDFETAPNAFTLEVTASDAAGNTTVETVDVSVLNDPADDPVIPTTNVTGTGSFAAQAGPELFVVAVDDSSGAITNPDFDGVATITGFDPTEDRLVFQNEPGSTVVANDFLTSNGVDVLENPFSNTLSYVFGDDPTVPGTDGATVVIDGLSEQDANNDNVLDFIDIA